MNLKETSFLASQFLLPHHLVSRLAGSIAESELPFIKNPMMKFFLNRFGIDLSEAERTRISDYNNFNDFFTRALNAKARPIMGSKNDWISPVDAQISQVGSIEGGQLIQAKGKTFTLTELLGSDHTTSEHYQNGQFLTLYLSPKDYHRIHMPMAATLLKTTFVPGKLFSVNPLTANNVSRLFARNERLVCEFDSHQGRFIMVLVGAMVVASIETTWAGIVAPFQRRIQQQQFNSQSISFAKGEEMGRFRLGSTVIMIFEENQMNWHEDIRTETKVRMGQLISRNG
jgi:phosphatidylserine decarboxylase